MNLTDLEKKKIRKVNEMISDTNKRILSRFKKLSDSVDSRIDGNDIDIDNVNFEDEKLIRLIKYRNKLREKHDTIAGRIWDERFDEENYEKI